MPTTTNFSIPYPGGSAAPNVPADLQALAVFIDNLLKGLVPVSASIGYGGDIDPAGGFWMLEDGRALNASTDATLAPLYALIGNKYGGTNNTNFRLPDSRGRLDVAPSNMNNQNGGNQTGLTRVQAALGNVFGETVHQLLAAESGVNGNGWTQNGSTGVDLNNKLGNILGDDGNGSVVTYGFTGGGGNLVKRQNQYSIIDPGHYHFLTGRNADSSHNNTPPIICKNKIMRVR